MLVLALPLFLGTFLFAILIFMFFTEIKQTKLMKHNKGPKITELPLITPTGQIINTVEELGMHLEFLMTQIDEKEKEIEVSKGQLTSTEENLKRLSDTTNEVKKYYMKLKSEIHKNEAECKELHNQIEDCMERQMRLRDEVNQNVKYFSSLLGNMESSGDSLEFEMVSPTHNSASKKHFL